MTEMEHGAALLRIDELMDARFGTPEGRELNRLCALVNRHENQTCSIDPPDPAEAAKFRREQEGEVS